MIQTSVDPLCVKYVFNFGNGKSEVFDIRIDRETMAFTERSATFGPAWARLDFCQCTHCPLDVAEHPFCPVALGLVELVERLGQVVSYEKTELVVFFEERWIGQNTTAQRGISSLMGLLMAVSGCPYTNFMKPMARFHLPLASDEETVSRASAMYLQAQYFIARQGGEFDGNLLGLIRIYDDLQKVNVCIANRLRESGQISELNALASLDMLAQTVPIAIEESLDEIGYLFAPYLSDGGRRKEEVS